MACVLGILLFSVASAVPAGGRLAVIPTQIDDSASGQVPGLFDDYLLTAVQNLGGYEVIGQEDISALLGFERQRDLFDCGDTTCIADIGGALGVDRIVAAKIARLADDWVATAKLINIAETRVESRVNEIIRGDVKALLLAVPGLVSKLFGRAASAPGTSTGAASSGDAGGSGTASADEAGAAEAGDRRLPRAYVRRPLTLPKRILSPEANAQFSMVSVGWFSVFMFSTEVGARYGIMDDLMVEARPLGFVAGDLPGGYSRFQAAITYRFLATDMIEMGGRFSFHVDNEGTLVFNPALPVRLHLGEFVRIDTGVQFAGIVPTASLPTQSAAYAAAALSGIKTDPLVAAEMGVPINVSVNFHEAVFVGVSSGLGILDLSKAGQTFVMPLGLFLGVTIDGAEHPIADIGGSFGFPFFLNPGGRKTVITELWAIGLTGRMFFSF